MAILTRDVLSDLMQDQGGPHISLYMPTYRAGSDTQQNQIRFKNLIKRARDLLERGEHSEQQINRLLNQVSGLQNDFDFWQRQSDGLAMFISEAGVREFRQPVDFKEVVKVGERFYLKQLISVAGNDGLFYVLAVSQNQVRLLQGSRSSIDEVPLEDVPTSLQEALAFEETSKQMQYRSSPSGGGRMGTGILRHGHDPSDEDKDRLLRFFRQVDKGLKEVLEQYNLPLVLAAVEYLHPIYRAANTSANLTGKGIKGNPDNETARELHAKAWAIVEPIFRAEQEDAIRAFNNLSGSDRVAVEPERVIPAAFFGRVETLFVAIGERLWGRFDSTAGTIHIEDEQLAGNEDLLDAAAINALNTGGTVHVLPRDEMPVDGVIAAVLRY